jgi:hypothetical protein
VFKFRASQAPYLLSHALTFFSLVILWIGSCVFAQVCPQTAILLHMLFTQVGLQMCTTTPGLLVEMGSFFTQVSLKVRFSSSLPPQELGLQVWATVSQVLIYHHIIIIEFKTFSNFQFRSIFLIFKCDDFLFSVLTFRLVVLLNNINVLNLTLSPHLWPIFVSALCTQLLGTVFNVRVIKFMSHI